MLRFEASMLGFVASSSRGLSAEGFTLVRERIFSLCQQFCVTRDVVSAAGHDVGALEDNDLFDQLRWIFDEDPAPVMAGIVEVLFDGDRAAYNLCE
jgi:hypothetical protein